MSTVHVKTRFNGHTSYKEGTTTGRWRIIKSDIDSTLYIEIELNEIAYSHPSRTLRQVLQGVKPLDVVTTKEPYNIWANEADIIEVFDNVCSSDKPEEPVTVLDVCK